MLIHDGRSILNIEYFICKNVVKKIVRQLLFPKVIGLMGNFNSKKGLRFTVLGRT